MAIIQLTIKKTNLKHTQTQKYNNQLFYFFLIGITGKKNPYARVVTILLLFQYVQFYFLF
jgi:hypothetical protein